MARAAPIRSGNTIEVARGSHFVSTELTPDVAVGDTVFLGEQADYDSATAYTVTGIVSLMSNAVTRATVVSSGLGNQGFTVSPRAQASLPFGSSLYKVGNYNLWDADKVAGCVCDDGFSGHDCSSMACPVVLIRWMLQAKTKRTVKAVPRPQHHQHIQNKMKDKC
jgi:hypothetical protein